MRQQLRTNVALQWCPTI